VGPLGKKWRPSVRKVEEWYVESQHLQGCSPRLCQLRTDGLAPWVSNVLIACWYMGPISWRSCVTTWLKPLPPPTPRLSCGGEWGDLIRRLGQSVFSRQDFSHVYGFVLTSWGLANGCLRGPHEMYGRGPYEDRACGVLIKFSPAWCTSIRIIATLRYEYRLFVAVIT
jgi:hypothetical protein